MNAIGATRSAEKRLPEFSAWTIEAERVEPRLRKVSIYEAIVESGGVTKEGDKRRVTRYRFDAQGKLKPRIVNLQEIEQARGEMIYLEPGDQIFVPDGGFRLNVNTIFDILSKASVAHILFGSPF